MSKREKQTADPGKRAAWGELGAGPSPAEVPKQTPLPEIKGLQDYLTAAYAVEGGAIELKSMILRDKPESAKIAVSIFAIDGADEHYAGINDELMCYSGSLVKVAAVYAAHDLRAQARMHAGTNFRRVEDFRESLASVIAPTGAVPQLRSMGVGLQPNLSSILDGFRSEGPNRVEFTPAFRDHHLSSNIGDQTSVFHNAGARPIIRALGYSYINVSMMRSGFYDPTTRKGIWLAGDYSGDLKDKAKRLAVSRVPVVNDDVAEGGAQAITTKAMNRMLRLVYSETGFAHITDPTEKLAANQDMRDVLTTGDRFDPSPYPPNKFFSDFGKVGIGNRGPVDTPGPRVVSEGSVVQWPSSLVAAFNTQHSRQLTGDFVLVWQNMFDQTAPRKALGRLVTSAMENFLKQS